MDNPWAAKMSQFTSFNEDERAHLDDLVSRKVASLDARQDILSEGQHSDHCNVMLTGLACRYKILPDGSRRIMAFLIPGDMCDAEVFVLKKMDHSVATLTPSTVAAIPSDEMKRLLRSPGTLAEAIWWGTLTDLGVLRERIIDFGGRSAFVRTAHLLYELLVRHRMVGLTKDDGFDFPITQEDLADATAVTSVHANRMLQKLRRDGLIRLQERHLTVLDPPRLKIAAEFNGNYLHLDRAHSAKNGAGRSAYDLV